MFTATRRARRRLSRGRVGGASVRPAPRMPSTRSSSRSAASRSSATSVVRSSSAVSISRWASPLSASAAFSVAASSASTSPATLSESPASPFSHGIAELSMARRERTTVPASLRRVLDTTHQQQETKPPTDASVLEDVVLNDYEGKPVRLGDLWSERPAVLVFVRHFGCVFCRQMAVDIYRHRHQFDEADVELAVIGHGSPAPAADFRQ